MAGKQRKKHGFAILIFILLLLLVGAVALFIYGSANNHLPVPQLPGKGSFALRMLLYHG